MIYNWEKEDAGWKEKQGCTLKSYNQPRELIVTWDVGELLLTLVLEKDEVGLTTEKWDVGVDGLDESWAISGDTARALLDRRCKTVEVL